MLANFQARQQQAAAAALAFWPQPSPQHGGLTSSITTRYAPYSIASSDHYNRRLSASAAAAGTNSSATAVAATTTGQAAIAVNGQSAIAAAGQANNTASISKDAVFYNYHDVSQAATHAASIPYHHLSSTFPGWFSLQPQSSPSVTDMVNVANMTNVAGPILSSPTHSPLLFPVLSNYWPAQPQTFQGAFDDQQQQPQ